MEKLRVGLAAVIPRSEEARNLGHRIRARRRGLQETQRLVAKQVGVGQATVARWEAGDLVPPFEHLLRVAAALGVSPQFLLLGEADAEQAKVLGLPELLAELLELYGEGAGRHLEKEPLTEWPSQMQTMVGRCLAFSRSPTTANSGALVDAFPLPLEMSLGAGLAFAQGMKRYGGLGRAVIDANDAMIESVEDFLRQLRTK